MRSTRTSPPSLQIRNWYCGKPSPGTRSSRRTNARLLKRLHACDQVVIGRFPEPIPLFPSHAEQLANYLVVVAGHDRHIDPVQNPAQRLRVVHIAIDVPR